MNRLRQSVFGRHVEWTMMQRPLFFFFYPKFDLFKKKFFSRCKITRWHYGVHQPSYFRLSTQHEIVFASWKPAHRYFLDCCVSSVMRRQPAEKTTRRICDFTPTGDGGGIDFCCLRQSAAESVVLINDLSLMDSCGPPSPCLSIKIWQMTVVPN